MGRATVMSDVLFVRISPKLYRLLVGGLSSNVRDCQFIPCTFYLLFGASAEGFWAQQNAIWQ
jgi:hypothetical protein